MKTYKGALPEITLKYKSGDSKKVKISSSNDAAEVLRQFFDSDTIAYSEEFLALYLNRQNITIGWIKISQGGMTGTVVDKRIVMVAGLKCGAHSMILSHNHPSGNINPSGLDIRLTKEMAEAGKVLEIPVLDHVIVTSENGHYSMADNGDI